jgi:hypothetical protein
VRNFWFRFTHLALCISVEVMELANQPCPLTTLEQWLRDKAAAGAYQGAFIAHYAHQAIHLPVQPGALAWLMGVFTAIVAGLYVWRGPLREDEE